MNFYKTENAINFRDMSGYPCKNGFTGGRIFRCGMPLDPSDKDIELFLKLGIKTVIDFRGEEEADERPSRLETDERFDYHNISLLEANPAFNKENRPLWDMYIYSLTAYGENYARVFRLMVSTDEPLLCHCFLGKDRTGVLCALLLDAAGVSRENILKDYSLSYPLSMDFLDREIKGKTGLIWEQDVSRLRSDKLYISKTMDYIDEAFGGTKGYLKHIGLTEDEISKVEHIII